MIETCILTPIEHFSKIPSTFESLFRADLHFMENVSVFQEHSMNSDRLKCVYCLLLKISGKTPPVSENYFSSADLHCIEKRSVFQEHSMSSDWLNHVHCSY